MRAFRTRLQFWLAEHAADLGVPFGTAAFCLIVAIVALAMWLAVGPLGPRQAVVGRIVGMGLSEVEGQGSVMRATIRVGDQIVQLETPPSLDCRIGDRIHLSRRTGRLVDFYAIPVGPHPCGRL